MQFLWEQLIVVSSKGIILCIVIQLTFFSLVGISYGFLMSAHNSTTFFLMFCVLLYNIE